MPKIKAPSVQSINLVLQAADSAPRPNGPLSRDLDKAIQELGTFFQGLLAPQSKSQAGAASIPQADAKVEAS